MASIFVVLSMLLMALPAFTAIRPANAATSSLIKFPFAAGATWQVLQGYNTAPPDGGSHYNCDPNTLTDTPSHTESCGAQYQYKYSLDLVRADGQTSGQSIYAPVNGTIRWIDDSTGGMSISMGSFSGTGYAFAFFHVNLSSGLAAGQAITQGQQLGTIAPAGQKANDGTPHVHVELWQTADQGNWSRTAVPFTGSFAIDGYDFPDKGATSKNQYVGVSVTSTNTAPASSPTSTATPTQATAAGGAPAAPVQTSPANGTTYQSTGITVAFTWTAVPGATQYQVSLDGDLSGWVSGTSWTSGTLTATGQYAWKVQSRNSSGTSAWSPAIVFWIDPANGSGCTSSGTPPASTATSLVADAASYNVNDCAQLTGQGFQTSEAVNIYIDSTASTPAATVNAATNGSFYQSLVLPDLAGGSHSFIARGAKSAKQASASFKMYPTIRRDPVSGSVGDSLLITGRGFGANETVNVTFSGGSGPDVALGSFTTNASGFGTLSTQFPAGTNGWHDYSGTGATSKLTAWGAMNIYRSVYANPSSGAPGAAISLTATGFPGSTYVTATWNGNTNATLCSGSTQSNGNFSCSFSIPGGTLAGAYPVVLGTAGGTSTSALVNVSGSAAISISIASGRVSSKITIAGGGFQANSSVSLSWDGASWVSVTANSGGAFSYPATAPNLPLGAHTLMASGTTPGSSATNPSATFTIATTGGDTGSRMTSYGTYAVTATIEGLVGGTTSNGHKITPLDHFVSLPSCTGTSCPGWSTGPATACGAACYVRVTNPATNICSVAPVYDVGPWFTNDNWWDPAADRKLNNLAANPNYLAQGYPATEANLDGLDVGYGPGVSNVGYATGNRAAIDVADGTWVDIGIDQNAGIAPVVVTMLWQTGEDYRNAMAACGQAAPGGGAPAITASATTDVKVGDAVTIMGSGFKANESVAIHRGAAGNPVLATGTASSTGSFSIVLTIPPTTNGSHTFFATGGNGSQATVNISIAAKAVLSSTSGGAGQTVAVIASGFRGSETVSFTWGAAGSAVAGSGTADVNGSVRFTVQTPLVNGSATGTASGGTSGVTATAAYTVVQSLAVSPSSGLTGSSVAISGAGWPANASVSLFWNRTSTNAGVSMCSVKTNAQGAFSCNATVPAGYAKGAYPIVAGSDALTASAQFTVTGSAPTPIPTATATATATPAPPDFSGAYTITDGSSSGGSQSNSRVRDLNLNTYWRTINTGIQSSAWVSVDLGSAKSIGRIRWWMGATGMADAFSVQISSNGSSWTTLTTGSNSPVGQAMTYTLPNAMNGRYVRFLFTNPNGTPMLGGVAEIAVYPGSAPSASSTKTSTPTRTPSPTPTATATPISTANFSGSYPLAGGGSSPSSQSSTRVYDHDLSTYWRTLNTGVQSSAWVSVDLGAVKSIGEVRWVMGATGMANSFSIQVSTDNTNWQPVTAGTDSPVGQLMTYTIPGGINGRYVRFLFTNPNRIPTLGGVAEIAVYAGTATVHSAAKAIVQTPSATVTGAPSPTATPSAAAEASPIASPASDASPAASATETPASKPMKTPTATPTKRPRRERATETPAPAPAETPTQEPATNTPAETPTEPPTPKTSVINAISAVSAASVNVATPEAVVDVNPNVTLLAGGPTGAVAAISFDVESIGAGKLLSATLVLTGGADGSGISNPIAALPGYTADESSIGTALLPVGRSAQAASSDPSLVRASLNPGEESRLDVTGSVTGDGALTFFVTGTPDQILAIAGRASGTPPRLELVVQPAP